jgi:hypothetical protein
MTIIITLSLLLVAYLFDLTASRTQIPSVILLLVLGWFVRETTTTRYRNSRFDLNFTNIRYYWIDFNCIGRFA